MVKSKQTVAVDVDDVLVPHGDILIDHLNQMFESDISMQGFYSLDELTSSFGKTKQEIQKKIHNFLESEEFAAIEPIKESIDAIKQLKSRYELIVVTARPGITHRMTKDWLKQHFPGVFRDVHFVNLDYQWGTVKKSSKQNACQAIGAEYLIDDSLKHIQEVTECGMKGILFGEYHWNQAEVLPANTVRAKDWDEVVKLLHPDEA